MVEDFQRTIGLDLVIHLKMMTFLVTYSVGQPLIWGYSVLIDTME
jgi:hypothetical protein